LYKNVVFIDRDGTINRDSADYIKSWSEFEFLPGSIEAIKKLTLNGFTNIVITNQSAIPRKLMSSKELVHIHEAMCREIESRGGRITDIFYCPHLPADDCNCRKPRPGLLFRAQKKYNIDLSDTIMVGDSEKDIQCAFNAGCRYAVLVKSGENPGVEKHLAQKGIGPDFVAENLLDAASYIISVFAR
jgi:D-glycero-D-manno-heptose 1,7-bisphosphate phosphatase